MIKQLSEFVEKVSYYADQIAEFTKQHAAEIHRVTDLLTYNPYEPLVFSSCFSWGLPSSTCACNAVLRHVCSS